MRRHSSIPLVVCIVLASLDVSSMLAADMPNSYKRQEERYIKAPGRLRVSERDCGKVIYDYRTKPKYSDVKTVCSGPWMPPSTTDY